MTLPSQTPPPPAMILPSTHVSLGAAQDQDGNPAVMLNLANAVALSQCSLTPEGARELAQKLIAHADAAWTTATTGKAMSLVVPRG